MKDKLLSDYHKDILKVTPKKMRKRYEARLFYLFSDDNKGKREKELNNYGEKGWEVKAALHNVIILQREIE